MTHPLPPHTEDPHHQLSIEQAPNSRRNPTEPILTSENAQWRLFCYVREANYACPPMQCITSTRPLMSLLPQRWFHSSLPWSNPVLPQVDSFVTAVSGQSCNLYWHAGSGSHVTTFRAGPPVSERGNGTFLQASTWMGGWNFFGVFLLDLFESFFWSERGNGSLMQASTLMGQWFFCRIFLILF